MADQESLSQIRKPRNAKFQESEGDQKPRISISYAIFLGIIALIFDTMGGVISLLDFIVPTAGGLLNSITIFPLATSTLYILYKKKGVEFKSTKNLTRFWGSLLIGFIPYISILPEYLLNVILITASTKTEDILKK